MESRNTKVIDMNYGILESGKGATSGIVLTINGIIKIRTLKVKRPNQSNSKIKE